MKPVFPERNLRNEYPGRYSFHHLNHIFYYYGWGFCFCSTHVFKRDFWKGKKMNRYQILKDASDAFIHIEFLVRQLDYNEFNRKTIDQLSLLKEMVAECVSKQPDYQNETIKTN